MTRYGFFKTVSPVMAGLTVISLALIAHQARATTTTVKTNTHPAVVQLASASVIDRSTAVTVVDSFHAVLLDTMKNAATLGIAGRYEKMLHPSKDAFNVPLMSRFVTGGAWKAAERKERQALVNAAMRMSVSELAVLFKGYSGESFKTTGTRELKDKSVLVDTLLVRPNKKDIRVAYRVRMFKDGWRVIDVMLDGTISQLLKRKGEYARTLEDQGLQGLTKLLNSKADEILLGE